MKKKSMSTFLVLGACIALITFATNFAFAQEYPNKPIRFIVTSEAGGSSDTAARIISQPLGELLKQPVVVEGKVGGNSVPGCDMVAKSKPDGYTILITAPFLRLIRTSLTISPMILSKILHRSLL